MKVLIIKDEKPASQRLMRLMGEMNPDIEIIDVLKSVEDSINWFLHNSEPDLIFMDIQLEDGICFEIFESKSIHSPIIFTTAYDEYTLKAFKVNSIDYLLKPIDSDELKNAIDKFNMNYKQTDYSRFKSIINQLHSNTKERFLIKIGEHYKSVRTSMINCFYIQERCNFIHVDKGKNYPIEYSLDKMDTELSYISRKSLINAFFEFSINSSSKFPS